MNNWCVFQICFNLQLSPPCLVLSCYLFVNEIRLCVLLSASPSGVCRFISMVWFEMFLSPMSFLYNNNKVWSLNTNRFGKPSASVRWIYSMSHWCLQMSSPVHFKCNHSVKHGSGNFKLFQLFNSWESSSDTIHD